MSRAYRVVIQEQLRRHVKVEDGFRARLEVLPILAPGRMGQLLGEELATRGFEVEGGQAVRRDAGGVKVAVDLESGELSVSATKEKELELASVQVKLVDQDDPGAEHQARAALREAARVDLANQEQAEANALRRGATALLEARLKDLQGELDQAVNRVTAAALKERAAQLGTIEEVREDPETGSLTIKVKV